jgi:26S proteasome regulatory subunit N1
MKLIQDKLLMEDGNKWLYKNKEHGMLSATASIGLVLLWDVDGGNILQYVEASFILVGFGRAARTRLFRLVNTQSGALCAPSLRPS